MAAAIVALATSGMIVGDARGAFARAPEGPSAPPTQLAVEGARARARRPPLDPAARELRTARGVLAGGIVLTTLCGVGLGLLTYAVVADWGRLHGSRGAPLVRAGVALTSCTLVSIGGIAYGGRRVRALRRGRSVAWTGGLGLRF